MVISITTHIVYSYFQKTYINRYNLKYEFLHSMVFFLYNHYYVYLSGSMMEELTFEEIEEVLRVVDENGDDPASSQRFASTTISEIQDHLQNRISPKTKSKEKWAMSIFRKWHDHWKVRLDGQLKVFHDIEDMSVSDLNYCLKFFIADARTVSGQRYPPRTLKALYYMIQHYMQYECGWTASLFKDKEFKEARDVLDAEMRLSAATGHVTVPRRARPLSNDDENALWENGILGSGDPKQLQNTMIFLLGIHCGLRAATEHRELKFGQQSQLKLQVEDGSEILIYTETVSKNKNFGLKQAAMEPKCVRILPNNAAPNRCVISIYKKYISHRPPSAIDGAFHLACIPAPKTSVWYKNGPLGIHSIEKVTKDLMMKLGKDGYYTNTSLRRTTKTRLVEGGIPREVAKRRIGHISNADATYVCEMAMEAKVSRLLYNDTTNNITIPTTDSPKSIIFNNCVFNNCSL